MREVLICLLCAVLGVHSQYPQLNHDTNIYHNNSFIEGASIGQQSQGGSPLQCQTNYTSCCNNNGSWTDPGGQPVHEGVSGATNFYVTRGTGVINLNRISGGSSGMWRCDIPDSSGVMQSMYIYIGGDDTGKVPVLVQTWRLTVLSCRFPGVCSCVLHCPPHGSQCGPSTIHPDLSQFRGACYLRLMAERLFSGK